VLKSDLTITHPNTRIGQVRENVVLQIPSQTSNASTINYKPIDIPLSFLILLQDFNPLVYLATIVGGVAISLFVSAYTGGEKIKKSKSYFDWSLA
jgi:hypothetical protein